MVKISSKVLLAGGLATAIGLTGCKKYDDGPSFSLLTKTQRLTGDWEMTKYIPYGQSNMINNGLELEIEFDKDGDFDMKVISTYSYTYYGQTNTYTEVYNHKGDWEFSSDKEEIELDFNNSGMGDWDIEITRLTNKEFEGEITSDYYYGKSNLFSKVSDKSGDGPGTVRFEAEKD